MLLFRDLTTAWTATLLLYLGTEPAATSRYLGVNYGTQWDDARRKLIAHFSPKETPSYEHGSHTASKIKENHKRNLPVIYESRLHGHFPEHRRTLFNYCLFNTSGLHDSLTKERCILKRCATLQEEINASRLSQMTARDGRAKPTTVLAVGGDSKFYGNSY